MEIVDMDYSEHILRVKKFLKDSETALLHKDWDAAIEYATQMTVESRLLGQNIKLINDNQKPSVEF
jgi:hypothetical protein